MRKDFYIFRHGQTDCNKEGRWQGCGVDFPLNDTGVEQAQALAERIADLGIEHIYSSHLKRAHQTAEIVAKRLGVKVEAREALREGCLGLAEGLLKEEAQAKYFDIFTTWYSQDDMMNIRFPEGESKQEMQDRMFGVLESLLNMPHSVVGISSHSASIRYLLYKFNYGPHKMDNTALYHLVYEDGGWRLEQ